MTVPTVSYQQYCHTFILMNYKALRNYIMEVIIWILVGCVGTVLLKAMSKKTRGQTKCIICGKNSNGYENCQACNIVIDMYKPVVKDFFENDTEYQHYSQAMKTAFLISMGVKCSNCNRLRFEPLRNSHECIIDGHLITCDAVCEHWSTKG